jgi:hypothetical protein
VLAGQCPLPSGEREEGQQLRPPENHGSHWASPCVAYPPGVHIDRLDQGCAFKCELVRIELGSNISIRAMPFGSGFVKTL